MKHLVLLLFLFSALFGAYDEGVNITASEYFEDKSKTLNIDAIKNRKFTPLEKNAHNFGFSKSAYWFHNQFSVDKSHTWYYAIEYALLQKVDFYLFDQNGTLIKKSYSGLLRDYSKRDVKHRDFLFTMNLQADKPYDIYIRVESKGSLQFPTSIYTANSLIHSEQSVLVLIGIYYGTFLLLALFNLMLYFYTRVKAHLYYLWFISSFVIWQLTLDGTGVQYFWGDSLFIKSHSAIFSMSMTIFAALLFAKEFLKLPYYFLKMKRYIDIALYLLGFNVFAGFIFDYYYMAQVNMVLSIVVALSLLIISTIVYKRGFTSASWYMAGWVSVLLGTLLFALNKSGFFGDTAIFYYTQQIGSFFEMLFLSWALSDNAKLILDESIAKKDTLNLKLKEAVEDAIKEVRDKDKILMQQSRFAALGEMIEQIAHQWRQPLNTLALVNQDIYFKIQLGTFKTESYETAHVKMNESLQYMSKTIDDFRDFYKNSEKLELFSFLQACQSALSLSEAMLRYAKIEFKIIQNGDDIKVFGSRNQLIQVVMNLIKNSHDAIVDRGRNEGCIKLTILNDNEKVILLFEDDGGGIREDVIDKIFDPYFTTKDSTKGTGIGLAMVKDILEQAFGATIMVSNSSDGAVFRITMPYKSRLT